MKATYVATRDPDADTAALQALFNTPSISHIEIAGVARRNNEDLYLPGDRPLLLAGGAFDGTGCRRILRLTNGADIHIRGMGFFSDWNGIGDSEDPSGHSIAVEGTTSAAVKSLILEDLEVHNIRGSAFNIWGSSDNFRATNVIITTVGRAGINVTKCSNVGIKNISIHNTGDDGLAFHQTDGASAENIEIIGAGQIGRKAGGSFKIDGASNTTISNAFSRNCRNCHIIVQDDMQDNDVRSHNLTVNNFQFLNHDRDEQADTIFDVMKVKSSGQVRFLNGIIDGAIVNQPEGMNWKVTNRFLTNEEVTFEQVMAHGLGRVLTFIHGSCDAFYVERCSFSGSQAINVVPPYSLNSFEECQTRWTIDGEVINDVADKTVDENSPA